jgi:hypothetical protein
MVFGNKCGGRLWIFRIVYVIATSVREVLFVNYVFLESEDNGWDGHFEGEIFRSLLRRWPAISEKETVTNHLSYGRFGVTNLLIFYTKTQFHP